MYTVDILSFLLNVTNGLALVEGYNSSSFGQDEYNNYILNQNGICHFTRKVYAEPLLGGDQVCLELYVKIDFKPQTGSYNVLIRTMRVNDVLVHSYKMPEN